MRNSSKTKHRTCRKKEKIIIISNNKSNNYNSNNNYLKDGQNDRLEKKQTLIWIKNWLGLLHIWRMQALPNKQFKTMAGKKKQWDI